MSIFRDGYEGARVADQPLISSILESLKVIENMLLDGSVSTNKIKNAAVTLAKLGTDIYGSALDLGDTANGSGTPLARADHKHGAPVWATYTPVWDAVSGTNPAIGNGTLAGRYLKLGKLLFLQIDLTAGSTTTFGTSTNWRFSLPSGLTAATPTSTALGVGVAQPGTTTASRAMGSASLIDSTHVTVDIWSGQLDGGAAVAGFLDNATPSAWTTSGRMHLEATLELT